jgi:hypothetical protein
MTPIQHRTSSRRPGRLGASALLATALITGFDSSPASAGTVYVSAPGALGGTTGSTQVHLSNRGATAQTGKWLLLATDTNGVPRTTPATSFSLSARQTSILSVDATSPGLVEISGPTDLFVAAVYGDSLQAGIPVPTIGSQDVVAGGDTVVLQGLERTATRWTDLVLVNLDKTASTCTVALAAANGAALGTGSSVALKPLSQKRLADVLAGLVDAAGKTAVSATVSCTKGFYVHGWVLDPVLGATALRLGGSGASTLFVPGEEPTCPAGATCLKVDGLLHKPTPANPVGRVTLNTPTGSYKRIKLTMDVTVDDFYGPDPDGKHLLYWFVINKNADMPGMLYFRGPDAFTALIRHGMGLVHADKKKITSPFTAVKGHTYRVVNDYDMGLGIYTVQITDTGTGAIKTIQGTPNVSKFTFKAGDKFIVDMGFKEGAVPDEVPSYDWEYRNLRIEVIP